MVIQVLSAEKVKLIAEKFQHKLPELVGLSRKVNLGLMVEKTLFFSNFERSCHPYS